MSRKNATLRARFVVLGQKGLALQSKKVLSITSAFENNLTLYLAGAALLALSFLALVDNSAFAEMFADNSAYSPTTYHRTMSESMAVATMHGASGVGSNSPVSYHRTMSESMAVTANYGKAPNSYIRSMSEQASINSEMPTLPSQHQTRPALHSAGSSQRIDERPSQRILLGSKGDTRTYSTSTITQPGTTTTTVTETTTQTSNNTDFQEMTALGGDSGEPDDNNHIEFYCITAAFGTLSVIVLVRVARSKSRKQNYYLLVRCLYLPAAKQRRVFSVFLTFSIVLSLVVPTLATRVFADFGTDYRNLDSTQGALNENTKVTVSAGTGFYKVKPFVTSIEKGTPSDTTFMGYGWRTPGFQGKSIPAGTWEVRVVSTSPNLDLSNANARLSAYVYSTDLTGSNISLIGKGQGTANLLPLLGGETTSTIEINTNTTTDLTNRMLVVEFWVQLVTDPLVNPTISFRFGNDSSHVKVPTSPAQTTYYLRAVVSKANLEQLGLNESVRKSVSKPLAEQMGVTETINRSYNGTRTLSEEIAVSETMRLSFMKPISENLSLNEFIAISVVKMVSEEMSMSASTTTTSTVKPIADNLGVGESIVIQVSKSMTEQLTMSDTTARQFNGSRSQSEGLAVSESVDASPTQSISDNLAFSESIVAKVTARAIDDQLAITESINSRVSRSVTDSMEITESFTIGTQSSRAVADDMDMTEFIVISVSKPLSDRLGVTDTVAETTSITITVSDTMALIDPMSSVGSKVVTDLLAVTDNLQGTVSAARVTSDQLSIMETVTLSVSRAISESLGINESIAPNAAQTKQVSEELAATESIAISIVRSMSEQLNMTESAPNTSAALSMATSEQWVLTETIDAQASKSATEQLTLEETINTTSSIFRSLSEELGITEAVGAGAPKTVVDSMVVSESIVISVSKTITDQFATLESAAVASSGQTFVDDQLDVTESIAMRVSRSITDQLIVTESASTSVPRLVVDSLGMTESISITTTGETVIADQAAVTDSLAIAVSKAVTDNIVMSESTASAGSTETIESMAATDSIEASVTIFRAISESLTITDTVSTSPTITITITDSMAIDESFADISIGFNLNLGEPLVLAQGFATNFEGFFDQLENEGIIIADGIMLTLESVASASDQLAVQDQVLVERSEGSGGPTISESMHTSDSIIILVTVPPPPPPSAIDVMPNLILTETEDVDEIGYIAEPAKAVPVTGVWNMSSLDEEGLEALLRDAIGMPIYDVGMQTASEGIDEMTMILPSFIVSIERDGEALNGGAFLTPTLSDLPSGMQIIIPINVDGSINGEEEGEENNRLDLLGNMTVSFTPAERASNVTMLFTILDDNPEQRMTENLPAFYIDVTIVGDFTGATPDATVFFEELPRITFTVTEEWAAEQRTIERDSNGVPVMGLFFLDETTGEWIDLTGDIEPPTAAVNGTYTYTATLPHFSTYVVTAGSSTLDDAPEDDGGDAGGAGGSNRVVYVRSLLESLSLTEAIDIAGEGDKLVKDLGDSILVGTTLTQPQRQHVITVHNVTIAMRVADIQAAGIGTAVAKLNFEITNSGSSEEDLIISYWYSTGEGEERRLYKGQQVVKIGGGESERHTVEVPFSSAGIYEITIETTARDQTIATTGIIVEVPWITANLYILILIASIVVAASIGYVIYSMRTRLTAGRR